MSFYANNKGTSAPNPVNKDSTAAPETFKPIDNYIINIQDIAETTTTHRTGLPAFRYKNGRLQQKFEVITRVQPGSRIMLYSESVKSIYYEWEYLPDVDDSAPDIEPYDGKIR